MKFCVSSGLIRTVLGAFSGSIAGAIALNLLSPPSLLSPLSASAQTIPRIPLQPAEQMVRDLMDSCDRVMETTYRSAPLTSPDGRTQAYAEATLRKIKQPSSEQCEAVVNETVSLQIMVANQGKVREAASLSDRRAYIAFHPRSFSADGRFLVGNTEITSGSESRDSVGIFDLVNNQVVATDGLCESSSAFEADAIRYAGFISATEVAFRCMSSADRFTGDSDSADLSVRTEWFEAFQLSSAIITPLPPGQPESLLTYGTVEGVFEVVRSQFFP